MAACSPRCRRCRQPKRIGKSPNCSFLASSDSRAEVGHLTLSLAWDRLPPGLPSRFRLQCLDRSGAVLAGSSVNVAARTADFRRRLSFPEGDTCRCDEAGHCDLYLLSEGEAGSAELVATAADSGIQARQAVTIVSAEEAPPDSPGCGRRRSLGSRDKTIRWPWRARSRSRPTHPSRRRSR